MSAGMLRKGVTKEGGILRLLGCNLLWWLVLAAHLFAPWWLEISWNFGSGG